MLQKHFLFLPDSSWLPVMDPPGDLGSTEDDGQKGMEILTVDFEDDDGDDEEDDDGANFETPPLSLTIGAVLDILPRKKVGRILWAFLNQICSNYSSS